MVTPQAGVMSHYLTPKVHFSFNSATTTTIYKLIQTRRKIVIVKQIIMTPCNHIIEGSWHAVSTIGIP